MLEIRQMTRDNSKDIDDLFGLFEETREYFQIIKGMNPSIDDAVESLTAVPPGNDARKVFSGYSLAGELIGCSDIVFGYPDQFTAYLGLLLVRPDMQSNGYGSWVHRKLCEIALSKGYRRMRLSLIETNEKAAQYWTSKGYRRIGRRRTEAYTGDIVILEREL